MKRLIIVILSCLYCFCLPISIYAVEDNDISNFDEMKMWLEYHSSGEMNLTSDIIIDEEYIYDKNYSVTINTNGHTLYIKEKFIIEIYNPNAFLIIKGHANENGLLHILKGGYCEISNTNVYTSQNEVAILQEEESVLLMNTVDVIGDIRYAIHPTVISYQLYSPQTIPYITLKENENLTGQEFPTSDNVKVNYQGQNSYFSNISLKWNLNEYTDVQPYQFYIYHAQYEFDSIEIGSQTFFGEDIKVYKTPIAHVISTAGGFAVTKVEKKNDYEQKTYYNIYLHYQEDLENIIFLCRSSPDETWKSQELFYLGDSFRPQEKLMIFYDENPYLEFYVEATINGEKYNSNVAIMDNGTLSFDDIEGGRGGGVDVIPDDNQENNANDETQDNSNDNHQDDTESNIQDSVNNVVDEISREEGESPSIHESINHEDNITEELLLPEKPILIQDHFSKHITSHEPAVTKTKKKSTTSTQSYNSSSQKIYTTPPQTKQIYYLQIIIGCSSCLIIYILTKKCYEIYWKKAHK